MSEQAPAAADTEETEEKKPREEEKPKEPVLPQLSEEITRATRLYELCLLFDPAEASRTWDKLVEWVTELIEKKYGGHFLRVDKWADSRKLTYEINELKRGTYMVVYFRAKPATLSDIDRDLRLDEKPARHIIIHHEVEPPTVGVTADERREEEDAREHRGPRSYGR